MSHVLMVIAPEVFRDEEYAAPKEVLEASGTRVTTASLYTGTCHGKLGMSAEATVALGDAHATDYDAVVFVGGAARRSSSTTRMRMRLPATPPGSGMWWARSVSPPRYLRAQGCSMASVQQRSRASVRTSSRTAPCGLTVRSRSMGALSPPTARMPPVTSGWHLPTCSGYPEAIPRDDERSTTMQLKIYRCHICGEVYLGYDAPENLPLLRSSRGVHETPLNEYPATSNACSSPRPSARTSSPPSSSRPATAASTSVWRSARTTTALRATYKRLAKVEAEHCELFCKLLKVDQPADLMTPGETTGSWASDIEDSLRRENRASELYRTFAGRATNDRLKEVWNAVAEVEGDHITLDELAKTYL